MDPSAVPFPWMLHMDKEVYSREGRWYFERWEKMLVIEDNTERLEALMNLLVEMHLCPPRSDDLHKDSLDKFLNTGTPRIMELFRAGPCTSWPVITAKEEEDLALCARTVPYKGRDAKSHG